MLAHGQAAISHPACGTVPIGVSVDENSAKFLAVPLLFGPKWVPDESER